MSETEVMREILNDLSRRFSCHEPRPGQPGLYEELRAMCLSTAIRIGEVCPASRERSLAWTKLEETVMWANAAIARYGAKE